MAECWDPLPLTAGNPLLMEHSELQFEVERLLTMRSVFQQSVNAARGRAIQSLVEKVGQGVEKNGDPGSWHVGRLDSLVKRILGSQKGASYGPDGHWRGLTVEIERSKDAYYSSKMSMGPEVTLLVKVGYSRIGSLSLRRSKLRNPEKACLHLHLHLHLHREIETWWDALVNRVPALLSRADEQELAARDADLAAEEAVFDGAYKLAAAVAKLEALEAAMSADAEEVRGELIAA